MGKTVSMEGRKVGTTKANVGTIGEVEITVVSVSDPNATVPKFLPRDKSRRGKHAKPWYKRERW